MIKWKFPIENIEQLKDCKSIEITVEQPEPNGNLFLNCQFLDIDNNLIRNDRLVHVQVSENITSQVQPL